MKRGHFAREFSRIRQHEKSADEPPAGYDQQIFVIYFKSRVERGRHADYMAD